MKLTQEQYDDLISKQFLYNDIGCSCHINPPCHRCVEYYISEEELEAMKKFEKENL